MDLFDESDGNHGILQIDASNAFNSINRAVTLHNLTILCPEFSTYVTNCYQSPARLFIAGGKELLSNEGTTQGDPVAMAMYAIGITPLLYSQIEQPLQLSRIAFADDFTGVGSIENLRSWFDFISLHGPMIGYFPTPSKSWLIVKESAFEKANREFEGTGVNITTSGNRHLGAIVGSEAAKKEYIAGLVKEWTIE